MTIPTSYTIRALNRWLAALKLETDSPIIRALHAAVDELDNDPNDLVADAEALLLAAASMSVLSFDALEHAAGEIGLEVDEEERAEVRESATVMQGLADLLGEIRTRTAEDLQVEDVPFDGSGIGPDDPRDAKGSAPDVFSNYWVAVVPQSTMEMHDFMANRIQRFELTPRDAALAVFTRKFSDLQGANVVRIWVHPSPEHGEEVKMTGYTVHMAKALTVRDVEEMLLDTESALFDIEIVDEPAPGMAPPPQDVQDLFDGPVALPVDDTYDTTAVPELIATPTTQV